MEYRRDNTVALSDNIDTAIEITNTGYCSITGTVPTKYRVKVPLDTRIL